MKVRKRANRIDQPARWPHFQHVIATYYNADSLPLLFVELDKFENTLASLGLRLELIFVDDDSGDGFLCQADRVPKGAAQYQASAAGT